MKIFRILLSVVLFSFINTSTNAADIKLHEQNGISISGEIVVGDYEKLRILLKNTDYLRRFLNYVSLNSKGGDVGESLKIANLFNKSFAKVIVENGNICFSSCFLIFAGAVDRTFLGKLGVHRLSLTANELSVKRTEDLIIPVSKGVDNFLIEKGIPRKIVDTMNETSPSDITIIDHEWLQKHDLLYTMWQQPTFADVVEKSCGKSPFHKGTSSGFSDDEMETWNKCNDQVRHLNLRLEIDELKKLLY